MQRLKDGDAEIVAGDRKSLTETEEEEKERTEQVTEEVVPTLEDDTGADENLKMPSIDGKKVKPELEKAGKLQNDSENSQKKLDKILPCPRCSSMDTKFCYYNNYNINEPRHFCKACQQYWIVGGKINNVKVGAGRRRKKNSGSQTGHLSIERVVSFALGEKKLHSVTRDCLRDKRRDRVVSATSRSRKNDDYCSSGSSITVSNSTDEGGTKSMTEPGIRKLPCLSAVPWPYQWQFHPRPLLNEPLLSPKSSSVQTSPISDPSPAQLCKHSREDNEEQLDNKKLRKQVSSGCVLVPKILRIGDPDEPAKISSIWAALGIKNEYSLAFGGIPKSKSVEMNCASEKNLIMHANPAAFCRSQSFQESS